MPVTFASALFQSDPALIKANELGGIEERLFDRGGRFPKTSDFWCPVHFWNYWRLLFLLDTRFL